jgi:hypothetical protein
MNGLMIFYVAETVSLIRRKYLAGLFNHKIVEEFLYILLEWVLT